MTIEQFVALRIIELEEFALDWEIAHENNPTRYPLELNIEEWHAQEALSR